VYQNGVKLSEADYTATTGTTVVLATGATVSDMIEIVVYDVFSVADTVSKADGGQFDNAVTITTADNNAQLTLVSTDADASSGPQLDLYRNSASPADSDVFGRVRFLGENDADEQIAYATIFSKAVDVSDGTESANLRIDSIVGGTNSQRLEFNATEAVFNEGGANIDFRVESDTNTNMLFVDAGNDRVGIGTNSPTEVFEVHSGSGNIAGKFVSTDSLALVAFKDNSTSDVVLAGASGDNLAVSHDILFTNASKGVYLGVTAATASNLLDDYEEGTHSFTEISGQASITTNRGNYTKIGRLVMLHASVTVGSNTNTNPLNLSLPFSSSINGFFLGGGNVSFTTLSTSDYVVNNLRPNIENQAADIHFIYNANSTLTCANASTKRIDFFCTYHVE
jgi:hypothetical protein